MGNSHKPAEPVLFVTPVGLETLGSVFESDAPYSACRLCGAIYQSDLDRKCLDYFRAGFLYQVGSNWFGHSVGLNTLQEANERRERWRELHERRYHTEEEILALKKTGQAFTPEAAHRLAPYGIIPLGNMSEEIVDALFTAPRAPVDDPEGGE